MMADVEFVEDADGIGAISRRRHFVCYLYFMGFDCISFGFHVCVTQPNIEIHLPFCFVRIGWVFCDHRLSSRCFGYDGQRRAFDAARQRLDAEGGPI